MTGTPKQEGSTFARTPAGFRYGLGFTDRDVKDLKDGEEIVKFYTHTVSEEALGDGFNVVDMKDKELPVNEQIQELFETNNIMQEFIQLVAFARAYGSSGGLVFDNGEFKAFPQRDLLLDYDIKTRKYKQVTCVEKFASFVSMPEHRHVLNTEALMNNFSLCILEEGEKTFEGVSVLRHIWDTINSIWILGFSTILYVIRFGAGFKVVYSDASDDEKNTIDEALRNAADSLILHLAKDDKLEFRTTGDGGQIPFTEIAELFYGKLAAGTGIPSAVWRGVIEGQREGAKMNRSQYYNQLKLIQDKSTYYLKRLLKQLSQYSDFELPEKFKIDWKYKEEISEVEQATLEQTKANTAVTKGNYMTGNEIREELDLEPLNFFKGDNESLPMVMATKQNMIGIDVQGLNEQEIIEENQDEGQETEESQNEQEIIDDSQNEQEIIEEN